MGTPLGKEERTRKREGAKKIAKEEKKTFLFRGIFSRFRAFAFSSCL
jgi:hypothetical protein